jgi:pilus assembly protein CpaF
MTRPLLVTNDPMALDNLLRLAATAGVEVEVAADVGSARRSWAGAPLVVVGPDLLDGCAASRLGRRGNVVALGDDLDDATIWRKAVDVGAERVVFLPDAEPWLVQAFADAVETTDHAGLVVATLGGRGGAGATTLSVALAQAGTRRALRTLLVDGDPLGGGVDLVLGVEDLHGLRWPDLITTRGRLPAAAVIEALPHVDGIGVLSWDRGDVEVLDVLRALQLEISGAGPLAPLLADPLVTDVLVNGPADVWVDRGDGLERASVRFADDAAVRRLAVRLVAPTGRRLDDAQPWVDARLADGVRLHAILPPVSSGGTSLSLRVPRRRAFSLDELVDAGTVPPTGAVLLARLVASQQAFLVSGGTGTGKTTLLSALLSLADPTHRVLLVEDAGELLPDHPHVVRLEARPPNAEGAGQVTLRDLVRNALRMRPDRLVVGEVRGAEVVDLLAALNTGHEGGCGTVHANSAGDVPARLEALAASAGLGREALHSQLASALKVVVHLVRGSRRRVAEVCVLRRAGDLVAAVPAWTWDGASDPLLAKGFEELDGLL